MKTKGYGIEYQLNVFLSLSPDRGSAILILRATPLGLALEGHSYPQLRLSPFDFVLRLRSAYHSGQGLQGAINAKQLRCLQKHSFCHVLSFKP
jgi:hypothetical protein